MNKEETIEEAGKRCYDEMYALNPKGGMKEFIRMAVSFGAAWQAEKGYSEDQLVFFSGYCIGKRIGNPDMNITDILQDYKDTLKKRKDETSV